MPDRVKSLVCAMSPALLRLRGISDMCVLKYYGFPLVKSVLRAF